MVAARVRGRRLRLPRIGHDVLHTKPSIATPHVQAATIGSLYVLGSTLALIALFVSPQPAAEHTAINGTIAAVALLAGFVTIGWGSHFPERVYPPLVAAATIGIGTGTWLGGGGVTSLGLAVLFNFIAMDAFFFFAWPIAIAQLALLHVCAFSAFQHVHMAMSQVVLVQGTATGVAVVVGWLARAAAAGDRDAVTGVANRRGFDKALQAAVASARRSEVPLSVIMLDFDWFKAVNDRGGHAAGDRLLRNAAREWAGHLRPGQTLARFGGDEFAVLLPDCPAGRAAVVADQLRTVIRSQTTCSAGVAELMPHDTASMLVARADVALYEAKANGRDRTAQHLVESRIDAARLASALSTGQFQAWYEPIVNLRTGGLVGTEAEIRWVDGAGNTISPATFIAAAERSDMICSLWSWIMRQAYEHAADELAADGTGAYISINATGIELCSQDYVATVLDALRQIGMDPRRLVIEVTESTFDAYQTEVIDTLHALRRHGVRIAIGDFGTGLSSLSRLNRLPADILKIDRSLVATIGGAESVRPILQAIVSLAKALGMTTVADGVDSHQQADVLTELGCENAQGALFGRPQQHAEHDAGAAAPVLNEMAS